MVLVVTFITALKDAPPHLFNLSTLFPFAVSDIFFKLLKTGVLKAVTVKMSTCLLKNPQVAKQHLPRPLPSQAASLP